VKRRDLLDPSIYTAEYSFVLLHVLTVLYAKYSIGITFFTETEASTLSSTA
jgi:hypothetical protein